MHYSSQLSLKIHNKWRTAPTMVKILPNRVNIIVLGVGDIIKKWPSNLIEGVDKICKGRTVLKISVSNGKNLVSNGKNNDTRLLVRENGIGDTLPLAIANIAYTNHMTSSIFKFTKQGKTRSKNLLSQPKNKPKLYRVDGNVYYITPERSKNHDSI
jgi:hypothetical protein